jgi:hypothetical protein
MIDVQPALSGKLRTPIALADGRLPEGFCNFPRFLV